MFVLQEVRDLPAKIGKKPSGNVPRSLVKQGGRNEVNASPLIKVRILRIKMHFSLLDTVPCIH